VGREKLKEQVTGMSASQEQPSLSELRDFIRFLQHLWAALAGISVFFPLSNSLAKIIPLGQWDEGGFVFMETGFVSAIATLACVFMVLWLFTQRAEMRVRKNWDTLPEQAMRSFAFGVGSLILYWMGQEAIVQNIHTVFGLESGDAVRIVGDVLLLLVYGGFFVLVTRAFLLLGLREYLEPEDLSA
jgi:hypothetical protein